MTDREKRLEAALSYFLDWYTEDQECWNEELAFESGRQLYHVATHVAAVLGRPMPGEDAPPRPAPFQEDAS